MTSEYATRDALNAMRECASFAYYNLREGGYSHDKAHETVHDAIDEELSDTREDFERDNKIT